MRRTALNGRHESTPEAFPSIRAQVKLRIILYALHRHEFGIPREIASSRSASTIQTGIAIARSCSAVKYGSAAHIWVTSSRTDL